MRVRESFNAFERNTVRERKKEVVQSEAGDSEWKTVKSRRSRYLRTQTLFNESQLLVDFN